MAGWKEEELAEIGEADELAVAPERRDGTLQRPRIIWVVRHGDDTRASGAYARASSGDDTSDGTINALIANASWDKKKPGVGTGQATAAVEAPPEPTHAEMLSPDLVFTEKDKEKDDGR